MRRWERLRGRAEFDRLFASGRRLDGEIFRCLWLSAGADAGSLRVAFAVPGRLKTAVRRNRVRRLMRAAFDMERRSMEEQTQRQRVALRLLFLFRPRIHVDARRLALADIYPDIAALCRSISSMLRDQVS